MAINLTDSLNAATTKGKLGDAKQIYFEGDQKNVQEFYDEAGISYEENPEFVSVKLDAEGRVLEAVRKDGTKVLPVGTDIQGIITETIDNPEWAMVYLIGDKIAFGIKKDGTVDWGYGIPTPIKKYIEENLDKSFTTRFATKDSAGVVQIGEGLSITENGILSAYDVFDGGRADTKYGGARNINCGDAQG